MTAYMQAHHHPGQWLNTPTDARVCVPQEGIPTSLLKLTTENMGRAIKMFGGVQKYMLQDSGPPDGITPAQRLEIAGKLLHQAVRRPELKDELYMQVRNRRRTRSAEPNLGSANC